MILEIDMAENKFKLIYTPISKSDFVDILDYIAEDDIAVALNYISKLEKIISTLSEHPFIGVPHPDPNLRLKGYRVLIIDNYNIYYKPIKQDKTCTVFRVLAKYMDHTDMLI